MNTYEISYTANFVKTMRAENMGQAIIKLEEQIPMEIGVLTVRKK